MPRAKKVKKQPVRLDAYSAPRMQARYDAAQTTDENRNLWGSADSLSADAANSLGVRTILRNRGWYVFQNNPRCRGMLQRLGFHTVGTGPRLQMQMGEGKAARKLNDTIEDSFTAWAKEVRLGQKLRILRVARAARGEGFLAKVFNPNLSHPVKLDLRLIDCDRVTNPNPMSEDFDGIELDEFDRPVSYKVLKVHPGGSQFFSVNINDATTLPASQVCHYFAMDRPEQHRGIPDLTPAIQPIEEGRRFRSAVLSSAEAVADIALALETNAPADSEAAALTPMSTAELRRGLMTTLPEGWKLSQAKAEQPTTTYKEFSRELLSECANCIHMPLVIAALDCSGSNMSGAYVDWQPFREVIRVERVELEDTVIDSCFDSWLTMAFDPGGELPLGKRIPSEFPHAWFWPQVGEHADPSKVANGQKVRLEANMTTLSKEYGDRGEDWEKALRQRAKEKELMRELGFDEAEISPGGSVNQPQQEADDEDEE